jgi:hypothetical protein
MNWDNPAERAALIEAVGAEEYSRRRRIENAPQH